MTKDVHTEHCCSYHGCKYGDDDCTVVTGQKVQSFFCEFCDWEEEAEEISERQYKEHNTKDHFWLRNFYATIMANRTGLPIEKIYADEGWWHKKNIRVNK